jgi:uncharacterized paraquat-inducible protein A
MKDRFNSKEKCKECGKAGTNKKGYCQKCQTKIYNDRAPKKEVEMFIFDAY